MRKEYVQILVLFFVYLVLLKKTNKPIKPSSKVAVPFRFPPAMNESSCCSTSSPAFGVVIVLDFGHSNRYIVKSHCCFNLQCNVKYLFICLFANCLFSFGRCLFRSLAYFFFLNQLTEF